MTSVSNSSRNFSLFAGFTFTAITILLTRLPDLGVWQPQIILFFLAVLFSMLIYELAVEDVVLSTCIRFVPKIPVSCLKSDNWQRILIWILFGASVWLLFLLYNLIFLALATGILYALTIVRAWRTRQTLMRNWKPFRMIDLYESED